MRIQQLTARRSLTVALWSEDCVEFRLCGAFHLRAGVDMALYLLRETSDGSQRPLSQREDDTSFSWRYADLMT
jgi:hypothetical protein